MHYVLNFSIYILTGSILLESYNGSKPFKSEILQLQDREHDFSDWLFNYNHIKIFFIAAHCIGGKSLYRFIKREGETYRIVLKQMGVSRGSQWG